MQVRQSVKILSVRVERADPGVAAGVAAAETAETAPAAPEAARHLKGSGRSHSADAAADADDGDASANGEGRKVMHSGDVGVVKFRFLWRPEYVRPGMRVMLREGRMRSVGEVL